MIGTIVGIAAIALSPAFAQAPGADEAGGPANEAGLHGQFGPRGNARDGAPRAARGDARQRMQGPAQRDTQRGGYIETNVETEAIWKQIGELKAQQHQAQWELYLALNQEGANRETVRPQMEKLRELAEQMAALNDQLEPYRKQMLRPEGEQREGRAWRGARQQGGAAGADGDRRPRNPQGRQAPAGDAQ